MTGINKALFGVATFGLGAVTGYLVSKKSMQKQYRLDVADIQAFYKEKLDELGVMEEGFDPPDDAEYDEDEEDFEKEDVIASYRGDKRRVAIDYSKPSLEDMQRALNSDGVTVIVDANGAETLGQIDEYGDDVSPTPNDPEYEAYLERAAEEYAIRRSENMKNGEPYLIEPEEYAEGPEEYERQTLYYYSKDRVLCEDDDSQVEEEEDCVGFDYEDTLDMQTTVWVRNDRLRVLYEIHRIDESYTKAVMGVSETPREREFRIQGRRKQALDNR